MRPSKTFRVSIAWIVLLLIAGVRPITAQAPIQGNDRRVVVDYLRQDCGSGDRNPRAGLEKIMEIKVQAIPFLWDVLRDGPPADEAAAFEGGAKASFARNRTFLAKGGLRSLKNDSLRTAA